MNSKQDIISCIGISKLCNVAMISLFILLASNGSSQTNYFIQHFNSENGLPQNSIKGIEIDSKGYVWLGTEAGLVRYDGSNFKLYNRTSGKGFFNKRVSTLHLNKKGLVFFRSDDFRYYKINKDNFPEEYIADAEEIAEGEKEGGDLSFKVFNACVVKLNAGLIPRWAIPDVKILNASFINSMAVLNRHYYYFNEKREFICVDSSLENFKKIKLEGFEKNTPAIDWLQQPITMLQSGEELFLRVGENIYSTHFSDANNKLVGSYLLRIGAISNVSAFKFYKEAHLFLLGSQTDGLYIYKSTDFSTLTFKNQEDNVFYAQAPLGENKVLTDKGILPRPGYSSLNHYLSTSILTTQQNHFLLNRWISNNVAGIVELDNNLQVINFTQEFDLSVNCMFQMKNGKIWIAKTRGSIGKLENNNIDWLKMPAFLDSFEIKAMEERHPDELWIAGKNGLAQINVQTGQCIRYPQFNDFNIRTLYQDDQGVLWIGTYGNGFYAFYHEKSIRMPQDRENYLVNAHSFLKDQNGYCWISTNQGLFQAKMSDMYDYLEKKISSLYYHYYDKSSGFLTNEFNGGCSPSSIKLNNGFFSFPSMKGIVQFDPARVKPVFSTNLIYIDAIQADTLVLDASQNHFVFSSKMNQLQITCSSPFFGTPYNHSIQYRLNGLDTTWQQLPPNGIITYNRLSKGDYELILRKQSGFANSQVEKKLFFTVKPSFYETWIFKSLIALSVLCLILFIFGMRVRILLRQRQRLEDEVKERTKEQVLLIENLETTVKELELSKEQLFKNSLLMERLAVIITHDLQSPLRFLADASERINFKANIHKLTSILELSSEVRKSSATIHHFVEDFGLWVRAFGKNFRTSEEPFLLVDLLDELKHFFAELLKMKGNTLHIEPANQLIVKTDKRILLIILRNLVDNANKNTIGGRIDIKASVRNNSVTILIKDTGKGMRPNILERLQKLISQPQTAQSHEEGIGYGYQFIVDFCKLLGITLEIQTGEGLGTEIRLFNLEVK